MSWAFFVERRSMKRLLALAILLPASAFGQSFGSEIRLLPLFGGLPPAIHESTGDEALDRAVSVCDAHRHQTRYMEGDVWEFDIPGCYAVIVAWGNSKAEKDRRAAEQKRKDDGDRAFIDQFVKGLPR